MEGTQAEGKRPRHAGVILHPSSLPGPGPVGEIGPYAHAFLEWMVQAGLDTWQMLPLHPVGGGASPYGSPSAFAADPRLISLETLISEGLLDPVPMPYGQDGVDNDAVEEWKMPLLRRAAARVANTPACRAFAAEKQEWLGDWALYAVLARAHDDGWWVWSDALQKRDPAELARVRAEYAEPIAVEEGLQYLFHRQWSQLRAHARQRGVRMLGDIPIFVSGDGCDTWAHRELFVFGADNRPDPIAGVPPDYFSPTGQRWGNPVYDWARHQANDFSWWKARLRRELELVDLVRLDHFRGFCANWVIPASEQDARNGRWVTGPGRTLFDAIQKDLGGLPLIAEDLGEITPDVEQLRDDLKLPGMKILQFAFGGRQDHPFLPCNFGHERWIVYTGTHDNETAVGWYRSTNERARHHFRVYCGRDGSNPAWALMREAWASPAGTAVAPMQDFLGLGNEARMNTPGVAKGNWTWRLRDLPWYLCEESRRLSAIFSRAGAILEP